MRHTSVTSRSVEFRDAIDDERKLIARQVLMHGERDRRIGMTIGHRKVSPFVSKMAQSLLAVERNRVMDFALDGACRAMSQQCVAPFHQHLVCNIAMQHPWIARGNPDLIDMCQRL